MVVWIMMVAKKKKNRRGAAAQRERREMERAVRVRAVFLAMRLKKKGHQLIWVAVRLGVSRGALGDWERRWEEDRLEVKLRGRPIEQLSRELREKIIETLHVVGPFEGLPVLQKLFPDVPRAELQEQLRRYRDKYVEDNHVVVHALKWLKPGTIWAMDFAEPPKTIDRRFNYILSVRDLGSGKSLMWLPVEHKTSREVHDALLSLFRRYGSPLVIKEDNDKAFLAKEVEDLFAEWSVEYLLSPPYYPRYNGAVESGIGTLKTYSHHEAARNCRPGEWTCDDVESARLRANELSLPQGHDGPTPQESWKSRIPPTSEERESFRHLVRCRLDECLENMLEAIPFT